MEKIRVVCIFLALIVVFSSLILGKEDEKETSEPTPAERAMGVIPPSNPRANARSWIHGAWMSLLPTPSTPADQRLTEEENTETHVRPSGPWANVKSVMHTAWMSLPTPNKLRDGGGAVRDAVIEKSRGTLDSAAESAALATGGIKKTAADAVRVAAETSKKTLSGAQKDQDKEKGPAQEL
ncbi:hypothetical protein ACLOJK_028921 [Asimina triloba]